LGYALEYARGPSYFTDNAGNPVNPNQEIRDTDGYKMYSHEMRVSTPKSYPVRATFGGSLQRQTDDFMQNFQIAGLSDAQSVTGWPGTYYLTDEILVKRDSAAFGEVTSQPTACRSRWSSMGRPERIVRCLRSVFRSSRRSVTCRRRASEDRRATPPYAINSGTSG
jgi:hypothetical protein